MKPTQTPSRTLILAIGVAGSLSLLPLCGTALADEDEKRRLIVEPQIADEKIEEAKEEIIEDAIEDPLPLTEHERIAALRKALAAERTVEGWLIKLPSKVLFEFDESELLPSAAEPLNDVADLSKLTGEPWMTVEGHTDAIGDESYNLDLSANRADAVKAWLVATRDLNPDRITTAGLSENVPTAPNQEANGADNPEGRQLNRRVEILLRHAEPHVTDTITVR